MAKQLRKLSLAKQSAAQGGERESRFNTELSYTFVASPRRKTLGLQVKNGQVIVRAPDYVEQAVIERFLRSKAQWLTQKITEQQLQLAVAPRYQIVAGGQVMLAGQELAIEVLPANSWQLETREQSLIFYLPKELKQLDNSQLAPHLANQFDALLKQQAQAYLPERLRYWSSITGLAPTELVIKKYKARWGSCSSKGLISLNSRLMMCPSFVIDYVLVHELCHLMHLNHSAAFWQLVAAYIPQLNEARQWLKRYQREFHF